MTIMFYAQSAFSDLAATSMIIFSGKPKAQTASAWGMEPHTDKCVETGDRVLDLARRSMINN